MVCLLCLFGRKERVLDKIAFFPTQTNKQTDQTTTLCVQEVEIYLERWEVLGALVVVDVG